MKKGVKVKMREMMDLGEYMRDEVGMRREDIYGI